MSVPVTREICKYVYIGGREAAEPRPGRDRAKNPHDAAHDLDRSPMSEIAAP